MEPPLAATVDRFENDLAVILVGPKEIRLYVPRIHLPAGVREGDVLNMTFSVDRRATGARRKAVKALIRRLKQGR